MQRVTSLTLTDGLGSTPYELTADQLSENPETFSVDIYREGELKTSASIIVNDTSKTPTIENGWVFFGDANWIGSTDLPENRLAVKGLFKAFFGDAKTIGCIRYVNEQQYWLYEGGYDSDNKVYFGPYYNGATLDTGYPREEFLPCLHGALDPEGYVFNPIDLTVPGNHIHVNTPFLVFLPSPSIEYFPAVIRENLKQIAARYPVIVIGEWSSWEGYDNILLEHVMGYSPQEVRVFMSIGTTIGDPYSIINEKHPLGAAMIKEGVTRITNDATANFLGTHAARMAVACDNLTGCPTMLYLPNRTPPVSPWVNVAPVNSNITASELFINGSTSILYGGGFAISADNVHWELHAPMIGQCYKLDYVNGLYIGAMGSSIYTSPDAITWTQRTTDYSNPVYNLISANGITISSGYGNTYYYSTDSVNWFTHPSPASGNPTLVTAFHDGTQFINVYQSAQNYNTNYIYSSVDGLNWTFCLTAPDGIDKAIAFNGGVVLTGPQGLIVSCFNGNWQVQRIGSARWYTLLDLGGLLIALDLDPAGGYIISSDGISWTFHNYPTASNFKVMVKFKGLYVAATKDEILTSADATTWTTAHIFKDMRNEEMLIAANNERVIVTSIHPLGYVWESEDAVSWAKANIGIYSNYSHNLFGLSDTFIICSQKGEIVVRPEYALPDTPVPPVPAPIPLDY